MKLQNKIALITGGTTGIGAATARLFQAHGAHVVVTGSNPATLKAADESLSGIEVVASDAGNPEAGARLVDSITAKHGRIDVLFLNAGIAKFAPIEMVDEAFFDAQFNINVRGLYFTVQNALQIMPNGSSIILTSSSAASSGLVGGSVYAATKAAVRSLGRSLAAELASKGIRVNTISPGPIETPIFGKLGMPAAAIEEFTKNTLQAMPLARVGQAAEVAEAALFLASDASSFTTGADLPVDGGLTQV